MFNDCCLHCDREVTTGSVYCSQQCRLADLDKSANATACLTDSPQSSPEMAPLHHHTLPDVIPLSEKVLSELRDYQQLFDTSRRRSCILKGSTDDPRKQAAATG